MSRTDITSGTGIGYLPSWDVSGIGLLLTSPNMDPFIQWKKIFCRLESMKRLGDNWDGEGAETPSEEIIYAAWNLLEGEIRANNRAPSRILPTPLGSILIEWQEDGVYTDAEIDTPNRVEWMRCTSNGRISHWVTEISLSPSDDYLMTHNSA